MKKYKLRERKNMYNLRRKGAPGSVMEPKSSAQGDDTLKKNMTLNGIKRVVTSGQDSIQLSFQLRKRNERKA